MLESERPDRVGGPIDVAKIATSKVVTTVFEEVLEAIHEGKLLPGERISDTQLAAAYNVSRTPVREALQRLREIGVVEASASRFTRVAVVSPRATAEAMVVWSALFGALLDETIPIVGPDVIESMANDHAAFQAAAAERDMQTMATLNFSFFNRLTPLSRNETLRRSFTSVMHVVRLGGLHLPDYVDVTALYNAQSMLLDAVRAKDVSLAHEAMAAIKGIRIPGESDEI
jgi:DNA-binding GntR family transcriptional regulator